MTTVRIGDLVYLETCSAGMIPARIVSFDVQENENYFQLHPGFQRGKVVVQLTAPRRGYKRGEIVTATPPHVVPRNHVRRTKYNTYIRGIWSFA